MSILDERTGIAVKVDGLLRIEEHGLLRIHLDNEVLKGAKANHTVKLLFLVLGKISKLATLFGSLLCLLIHGLDKVVSIYNGTLAGLHLSFRQLYHTVRQVVDLVCPVKAKLLKYELKYLEMIILLITHHINVGVKIIVCETPFGGAKVLGDVNGSTVAAKHQLAVKTVGGKVAPYGTIGLTLEYTHIKALLNQFLTKDVCL